MPDDSASRLRGLPAVRPCTVGKLARILRATLRAFPPPARRDLEGTRGRAERGSPCRRSFASPLLILGPSVKRRRSAGKGRVPRTRGAPGRRAFGDRAGALPPNPSRPQRTGGFAAGAQPRVHFFGYFLCASKESDSAARKADETQQGRTPSQRAALKDKIRSGFQLSPE